MTGDFYSTMKHKILFVCLGHICRSPMAEFIMKDMVHKAGRDSEFEIASAATSDEEFGNPVYPPAREKLAEHNISCKGHTSRQITKADYHYYDIIIAMDHSNLKNIEWIVGPDTENKISLLMEHVVDATHINVADPWYTGDFETTWRDVVAGCKALLAELK